GFPPSMVHAGLGTGAGQRSVCPRNTSRLAPPPVHPAELRFQQDEARLSVRANVRNVPPLFPLAGVILEPARRRPVRQEVVFSHPPGHPAPLVVSIPWEGNRRRTR